MKEENPRLRCAQDTVTFCVKCPALDVQSLLDTACCRYLQDGCAIVVRIMRVQINV